MGSILFIRWRSLSSGMSQSELAISIRSAFDAATDHYCDRGVVYLMLGTKHLAVLAVSLYTLRKYWPPE